MDWREDPAYKAAVARVVKLRAELEEECISCAKLKEAAEDAKGAALRSKMDAVLSDDRKSLEKIGSAAKAARQAVEEKEEFIDLLRATLQRAEVLEMEAKQAAQKNVTGAARQEVNKRLAEALDKIIPAQHILADICSSDAFRHIPVGDLRNTTERLAREVGLGIDRLQEVP